MKQKILGLRVAGIVFGLMALVQLTRLIVQLDIVVGGYHLPLWPSVIACIVLGGLAYWMWTLSSAKGN